MIKRREKHRLEVVANPAYLNDSLDKYVKEVELITSEGWEVYHVQELSRIQVIVYFKLT